MTMDVEIHPVDDPNVLKFYIDPEMTQFEEVGGTCSNRDNPDEICCTVRSIVIGIVFVIGISFLHQWTVYTYTSTYIGPMLAIIITYPVGHLWAYVIPNAKPFTQKEHGLILVMTNVAWMYYLQFNFAVSAALPILENDKKNFANYFFLVLAFQFLGFGLAGVLRRFLVWPTEVIWPQNLPLIAILRTLHERKTTTKETTYGPAARRWSLKETLIQNKLLFFGIVVFLAFFYEWFPLYIMPFLSVFSWMCMFNLNNRLLGQLTAVRGLALAGGGLTLDWMKITVYLGSPLILPGWALFNIAFGFVLIIWFIVPIVYGSNVRGVKTRPIAGVMFSGTTAMNLVTAFTSFAYLPCIFVHTFLFHGHNLWTQFRTKSLGNTGNDMHNRLMSVYPQVPDWWYFILFAISLIMVCVICNQNGWLPWYLVLLTLFINMMLVLPVGLVSSITGQFLHNAPVYYLGVMVSQGLNLGNESAKTYSFIVVGYILFIQSLALIQDMKLGHYLKIGPRYMLFAQALAGFVCSTFSVGMQYMNFNKYGINNDYDSSFSIFDYTLLGGSAFSDINGFFGGANRANRALLWAFLVGALLPIPGWLLSGWPRFTWLKHLHWPLILISFSWMPALLSAGALFTWLLVGLVVYFTIGKRSWSQRHIYLASGALDLGLNLALIFINTIFLNQDNNFPDWRGTSTNKGWDTCKQALLAQS
ncbi:unnamed protein product [Adineta steineri]|uniref:OPT superfamily oligopeptide transporter n=1 Tax=Adineta steineri TaxID=433720 RepID=A0A814U6J2_9BILA|nr:unnamed protein product [Adineta steineri]CAF3595116.1 unnamed protein product [Adineta steineri]